MDYTKEQIEADYQKGLDRISKSNEEEMWHKLPEEKLVTWTEVEMLEAREHDTEPDNQDK